jgi:hypothetical protein
MFDKWYIGMRKPPMKEAFAKNKTTISKQRLFYDQFFRIDKFVTIEKGDQIDSG